MRSLPARLPQLRDLPKHTYHVLHGPIRRYALAICTVAITLGIRLILAPVVGITAPFVAFLIPTIITAHLAGRGPAIASALLGGLAADYFFTEPLRTLTAFKTTDVIWELVYLAVSAVIIASLDAQQKQRLRAEVALRELARKEASLRNQALLVDLSHDSIIITDPERRITTWNGGAEEMYGWTASEARGSVVQDFLHTKGKQSPAEVDDILYREGRWDGELVQAHKDGRSIVVESRQVLLRDEINQTLGILEINRDITERRRVEEAFRESEARERARAAELEAIMDAVPAAIFVARDPECHTITGSRTTYDIFRIPPGSNLSMSAPDEEKPRCQIVKGEHELTPDEMPIQKTCSTGQPLRNYEFEVAFEDGVHRNFIGDAVPVQDENGRTRGAVGAFLDITDHKAYEERVRQAQKLESIGLLAGGIAHDFNNLLAGIMGHASLLQTEVSDKGRERIDYILKASERAADLTRQLLAYAGKGKFVVRPVNISEALNDLTELLYASIPKKVDLRRAVEPGLPTIEADPGQIQQIMMNLVINGAEAIPENQPGTVTVLARAEEIADRDTVIDDFTHERLAPGTYVCVEVRDTGCGMDEQTKSRIFDPFFTTKFTGRGLGLAAVTGVVRAHGGAIQVASSPGNGSTFRVLLPTAKTHVSGSGAAADLRDGQTVLVADDEEIVRKFARAALERCGYKVLTAQDGRDAVRVFEESSGRISLVLLDLMMPVMNGVEILELLRHQRPDLKVILISGYSEVEAARLFRGKGLFSFLQKPFTAAHLAERVKAAIGEQARQ